MDIFVAIAFVISLVGSIVAPTGAVLVKSYRQERRRIEAGEEPSYLPYTEEIYDPPQHKRPGAVSDDTQGDGRQKKPLSLPAAADSISSAVQTRTEREPREWLWQKIEQHEDGWILDILERPILIWGAQGSYKSYFAAFLALVRKVLREHDIEIADPHLELNKGKAWKPLLVCGIPAVGSRFDYLAIARRLKAFYKRLQNATDEKPWHSPIFDELDQYSREKDVKAEAEVLILKCLSDTRKGKEAPILIAHDNTQVVTGGGTGTHKAKSEGLVQLHLLSTSVKGQYAPLFRGELTGIPDENGSFEPRRITLDPDWMNAEYVLKLFPELLTEPDALQGQFPPDWRNQPWDRQILELTNDQINELIDRVRGDRPSLPETPETNASLSHDAETLSKESGQPGHALSGNPVDFWVLGTVSKYFPDTSETELFHHIKAAAETGQSARNIIRSVLKCTKSEPDSDRHYTHVGKPLFAYLIRRYGNSTLIDQFADFLEDNPS